MLLDAKGRLYETGALYHRSMAIVLRGNSLLAQAISVPRRVPDPRLEAFRVAGQTPSKPEPYLDHLGHAHVERFQLSRQNHPIGRSSCPFYIRSLRNELYRLSATFHAAVTGIGPHLRIPQTGPMEGEGLECLGNQWNY